MTNATRRTLVFGLLGLVAVFFIFNPFNLFSQNNAPDLPAADAQTVNSSVHELLRAKQDAKSAVAELFESNEIVIVGEFGRIKEEISFTTSLIGTLADKGVRALGVEYLLAKDQADIDKLMNSASFDDALARKLIFNRYVMWGYEEYVQLIKAAWAANTDRNPENPRFRLLGLNVKPNNALISKDEDTRDPAIMKKVFDKGLPDAFMAQTVLEAMRETPDGIGLKKILLYVNRDSSFARRHDERFAGEVKKLDLGDTRRMAEVLYQERNGKVATVLLHSPWPNRDSPVALPNATYISKVGFPASGLLDRVMAAVEQNRLPAFPFAVNLKTSTLGNIAIMKTDYLDEAAPSSSPAGSSPAPKNVELSDFGDLYILMGPIASLTPAQPIADFINDANLKQTLIDFAPQDREKLTAQNINEAVLRLSNDMTNGLKRFTVPKE